MRLDGYDWNTRNHDERQIIQDGLHRQTNIKNNMNVPERREIE